MDATAEKTVLVADDEEYLGDVWVEILKLIGARVVSAGSGQEAIEALQREEVHLVITDLRMPGSDGFELLRYMKENLDKEIPVIVCSGFFDEGSAELASLNITRFIPKPFNVRRELPYLQELLQGDSVEQ